MRVRGTTSSFQGGRNVKAQAPQKDSGGISTRPVRKVEGINEVESPFAEQLSRAEETETRKELDKLLEKIDEQAKIFLSQPIFENMRKYKELVQAFMKEVSNKLYKIREHTSSRFVKNRKVYFLLEKIDEKLIELTEKVLSEQAKTIELVSCVDEIRGMLMDLYS
jgi:hypothetical protein